MALGRAINDWTYGGDPLNNQVDRVRALVGDTDENFKLISNAEIEYHISRASDDYEAAYYVACDIQAWSAKYVDKTGSNYTERLGKVFQYYEQLAERLLTQAPMAIPRSPGLSKDKKRAMQQDTDLVQPQFSVGMLSEDAEAIRPNSNVVSPDDVFGD